MTPFTTLSLLMFPAKVCCSQFLSVFIEPPGQPGSLTVAQKTAFFGGHCHCEWLPPLVSEFLFCNSSSSSSSAGLPVPLINLVCSLINVFSRSLLNFHLCAQHRAENKQEPLCHGLSFQGWRTGDTVGNEAVQCVSGGLRQGGRGTTGSRVALTTATSPYFWPPRWLPHFGGSSPGSSPTMVSVPLKNF